MNQLQRSLTLIVTLISSTHVYGMQLLLRRSLTQSSSKLGSNCFQLYRNCYGKALAKPSDIQRVLITLKQQEQQSKKDSNALHKDAPEHLNMDATTILKAIEDNPKHTPIADSINLQSDVEAYRAQAIQALEKLDKLTQSNPMNYKGYQLKISGYKSGNETFYCKVPGLADPIHIVGDNLHTITDAFRQAIDTHNAQFRALMNQ